MKEEFQRMQLSSVQRLRVLGHQQNLNLTPANVVMGLQCRVSTIHHALLLLDKDTPISHQLDMAHALTDIADIAVYLIHLQHFLLDEGRGWTKNGTSYIRPCLDRPRAVPDTRPANV